MKYLVNRMTKEHRIDKPEAHLYHEWRCVEADSEGWIKHEGNECPLPHNWPCEIMQGEWHSEARLASFWSWYSVSHYRPILEPEKVQEPEPIPAPYYDPRSVSFNLLDRLKAAHEHAQQIPDLEAELREVLGGMGYRLDKLSPFVEPEAVVEPTQDMKSASCTEVK